MLGSILVPVGGVFLAHFVVLRRPIDLKKIYDATAMPAFNVAGIAAWIAGFIVYKVAASIGATLPALGASMLVYIVLAGREKLVTQK
jgi:purine-cytosine permease-like protein